jgi:DNA-binding NarL/FixJ family response regulator
MEKRVIILGAADLLKELLSETLRNRLGVDCVVARNMQESAVVNEPGPVARAVLLDDSDPNVDGLLAEVKLVASLAHVSFTAALYNVQPGREGEHEALLRGIKGFFYRTDSVDLLCRGINALFAGEIWVPREVLNKIAVDQVNGARRPPSGPSIQNAGLTRREMEILSCIAVGCTNDEIAARLSVSSHTVKTHLYRIYKKIHVGGRLQAALWAANKL